VPVPYAPGSDPAEIRYAADGTTVRQEWPLWGDGELAALRSLRVEMDRGPDPAVPGWTYRLVVPWGPEGEEALVRQELWPEPGEPQLPVPSRWVAEGQPLPRWVFEGVDASGAVRQRWIELPDGVFPLRELARDLGSDQVVVVTDPESGERSYRAFEGRELARGLVVAGERSLQLVHHADGRRVVYDGRGDRVGVEVHGGRVAVVRAEPAAPVLVLLDTGRVARPVGTPSWNAGGVRARFAVPGASEGVTAVYRFGRDGRLLREELPLTGGGALEAQWDVRVVVEFEHPADGPRVAGPAALRGRHFLLFGLATPEFEGGFTLVERATGVRRHYDPGLRLVLRDMSVELGGVGGYLRVDVRGGQDELRLIGADGGGLAGWRPERLVRPDGLPDGERVAVVPTAWDHLPVGERPLPRMVIDAGNGRLLGETLHVRDGAPPGAYWEIDYVERSAVLRDAGGGELQRTDRVAISRDLRIRQLWDSSGEQLLLDRS
jgi:hypothetical protein